ncbi:hypothetical protein FB567DRAFT_629571 [Paraphoma chrysanthemicola]|uniref:Protein kinase domain-containing protein n=1 Tax=Paraphoma chrysanthemicola TaxID=798071 RepID=A0A8K0R4E4_9PLEO|nr:hypothetical protein FB567DRAFT_629571 [Paraphoma chrysanthemicola]
MRPSSCPPLAPFLPSVKLAKRGNDFLGKIIRVGGTQWKITEALCDVKYQRAEEPFEGRQTFACTLLRDKKNKLPGVKDVVVKVKYQVRPGGANKHFIANTLSERTEALTGRLSAREFESALSSLEWWTERHRINKYTRDEIIALDRFAKADCEYIPNLLAWVQRQDMHPGDKEYMPGGYVVLIFMTKLPAKQLDEDFFKMTDVEREEIRQAFKVAYMEICKLGVRVGDSGMRNLMWDDKSKKCYIVDFEDWYELKPERVATAWGDYLFRSWDIADS